MISSSRETAVVDFFPSLRRGRRPAKVAITSEDSRRASGK
jgi:hypothetical protein